MNTILKGFAPALMALAAAQLAGCNAQGGIGFGGAGPYDDGTPGGGGGGGGGGLVPGTDITPFTCTAFAPAGSVVSTAEGGVLCTLTDPLNPLIETCSVSDSGNVIDNSLATFAPVQFAVSALDPALGGFVTITVDLPGPVAGGRVAGFVLNAPGDLLDVSVLRNLNVTTYLNASQQETTVGGAAAVVNLLGLLGSGPELVGFVNAQPYNRIELRVDATLATAALLDALQVLELCTNAVPAP